MNLNPQTIPVRAYLGGLRQYVNEYPHAAHQDLCDNLCGVLINSPLMDPDTQEEVCPYIPDVLSAGRAPVLVGGDLVEVSKVTQFLALFKREFSHGASASQAWNAASAVWPSLSYLYEGSQLVSLVDLDHLVSKVKDLAETCPDFEYVPAEGQTSCSNFAGGDPRYPDKPGCIVGQALSACGFVWGKSEAHSGIKELACRFSGRRSWELDPCDPRVTFLEGVQTSQDNKHPWGEAWDIAVKAQIEQNGSMFDVKDA